MNLRLVMVVMAALIGAGLPALAAPEFFIHDGDRMVFYGDSITDTQWYPTLVQTFVATRFPKWRNEFYNRGEGGDRAASLKRFERDVVSQKPQVLTFAMGYNDANYGPFDPAILTQFLGNVTESVRLARAANPQMRIMLMGPTPNETAVSTSYPRWVSGEFYPYALLTFGREEGRLAQRLGVPFLDMGTLYGQTMGLGRVLAGRAFALSSDGVHPQQAGQTFMAYHLLRALGGTAQLATVTVEATHLQVHAERCSVADLRVQDGKLSFRRLCESLPYPTPAAARPFSLLVDLDNTLNADLLTVTGLTAPSYALSVDGEKIAEVSAHALAEGVNLSAYPTTPMYRQALAVMDAVREKDLRDCDFWKQYITSGQADGTGEPLGTDAPQRAAVTAARQRVAEARQAIYALNAPRPHTITLEPLAKPIAPYADLAATELNQAFLLSGTGPVAVNWNSMTLLSDKLELQVRNPEATLHTGTVTWNCPDGWQVTPAQAEFTVAGGQTTKLPFTLSHPGGPATLPVPTATLRWAWSQDWAYPLQQDVELELAPHLTIPRSSRPVTLTGNLDDWQDATSVVLDNVHFYNLGATGRRSLWNGPADLSARYLMKWDDQALYFAALVRDDHHVLNVAPNWMWSQDSVQMGAFLQEPGRPDGRYEWGFGVYENNRSEVALFSAPAKVAPGTPEIRFQGRVDEAAGTCLYEIILPWARLAPLTPAVGKSLRFTAVINDADPNPGKGYNYLAWTHGIVNAKNPEDFATVILGN
ncbi:MAG TPA: GDSL-type esterase/lipase family protein [Armatimonadota bacterium]|jgi:lysophospholipase L1-like esterase